MKQITGDAIQNSNRILPTIILLEGFVTIALEILTIRQLIPVVGNSVVVTSLIIGIFLLFLAYGYRKGGSYQSNYRKVLMNNFTLAAIGMGVGLSYAFINDFFYYFEKVAAGYFIVPLLLYLLLITAPLVYLLGQTVPITVNLFKSEQSVGALSGKVLHISTLGSFLGAILTTLLLMNYLGVAWTIFINFCLLVTLVILLGNVISNITRFILLVAIGVVVYGINIKLERNLFVLTDNYANYQVLHHVAFNHQVGRVLVINNSPSSYITHDKQAFPYIERIKQILFTDLQLHNKNILVLGAGGFTLSAAQDDGNHFTYVDIDDAIATVIKKHFLPNVNGDFVAEDARLFLSQADQNYDVVVADTYSNRYMIPAYLLTYEYFNAVKHALKPGGIAIFNIIANPMLQDNYSKHLDNTLRTAFTSCMATPAKYADAVTNIIYICKKTSNEQDARIYSDNLNRATLDYFKIKQGE